VTHFPFETDLLTVEVGDVFAYHDAPRLFMGTCQNKGTWLVLWADEHERGESGGQDDWLCVLLSEERELEVRTGKIDLATAFKEPESGNLVLVESPWGGHPGDRDCAKVVKPGDLDPGLFHEPGVRLRG
jgi:uncharacterized protein DUF6575